MIYSIFIILSSIVLMNCHSTGTSDSSKQQTGQKGSLTASTSNSPFTLKDAEAILGEKAQLTDNNSSNKDNIPTLNQTYTAITADSKTGKPGIIYFMLETYPQEDLAQKAYADLRNSNAGHEGLLVISGLGDEAYFHTDQQNFAFILVRKGNKMMRMKVNPLTSHYTFSEFNRVTREISNRL